MMIKLDKPVDSVQDVFQTCISNFRNPQRALFSACCTEIKDYTEEYEKKMEEGKITELKPKSSINGLDHKELEKVYTQKMAKKGQPGRPYYDLYMSLPPNGICPYCGQRVVSTLDHYLPKSIYAPLVVTPKNLVPCCKDCNTDKLDIRPSKASEVLFNPYYEDLNSAIWLQAKIIEDLNAEVLAMTFSTVEPEEWDKTFIDRVNNHFTTFQLNCLYSKHAAQELVAINRRCARLIEKTGRRGVVQHLVECVEDYSDNPNAWKSAMYRELLDNPWFVNVWLERNSIVLANMSNVAI